MRGTPSDGGAALWGENLRAAFNLQRSINSIRCSVRNTCSIAFPFAGSAPVHSTFSVGSRGASCAIAENNGNVATVRGQVRCGGEQKVSRRLLGDRSGYLKHTFGRRLRAAGVSF